MSDSLFNESFELHTERLTIRRFTSADLADTFKWCSDPAVSKFLTWLPHKTQSDTQYFLDYCFEQYCKEAVAPWAVVIHTTHQVIGTCNFVMYENEFSRARIGYCLHQAFWHLGLGSEAVTALVEYGFKKDLKRIEAICEIGNTASARLLQRVGFEYEGRLRNYAVKGNALIDVDMYSILPPAYHVN